MDERLKLGLGTLAASVGLGVLADGLLRPWPWGINVSLWAAAAILAVVAVSVWAGLRLVGGGRWLAGPLIFFAVAIAWRDSSVLLGLNLLAVLTCLVLGALYGRAGRIRIAGLVQHAVGAVWVGCLASVGAVVLAAADVPWEQVRGPRGWGATISVLRGLLLATPLLLVFGGLLMAADAAFAGLASRLFQWDLRDLVGHLVVIGLVAWPVAGVLRQLLLGDEWADPMADRPPFALLGNVEMWVVLGALDLLFLAFVAVQFRYFFGGADLIEASATLTHSEYARRGFFELVYVAAFALPLLLGLHWMVPRGRANQERWFRVLAGLMIALLFVIMLSALQRMRLYGDEYGLTELRLYPTVFMGWLALVFVWFSATVLRGHREQFTFGALVAGFAVLAMLNAVNPDDLIAQVNLDRTEAARPIDGRYLGQLSADAAPTLVANLAALPTEDQERLAAVILQRWAPPNEVDWRSANWGRMKAWDAVAAHRQVLDDLARNAR